MQHDYWQKKQGSTYRQQQEFRSELANSSYREQEAWLLQYLANLAQERPHQPIRILDFGCGFGRIARLISGLPYVQYFGYDFSDNMTRELRDEPPAALASCLTERIRIADSFDVAYGADEKFDIILSISVLIHNPTAWVEATLNKMLEYLNPDGRLVLIENTLTAISTLQNFWHGGCWCHAFPKIFDGKADMHIINNFANRHGLYIVTPHASKNDSRYFYQNFGETHVAELGFAGVLERGLAAAADNAAALTAEILEHGRENIDLVGKFNDITEDLAQATQVNTALVEQLSEARAAHAQFAQRQVLLEKIGQGINTAQQYVPVAPHETNAGHPAVHPTANFIWNAQQDKIYEHDLPEMRDVLHVFHQEWFGIRAAAGALGGAKLAVTADRSLTPADIRNVCDAIIAANYARIVFHGRSNNTILVPRNNPNNLRLHLST